MKYRLLIDVVPVESVAIRPDKNLVIVKHHHVSDVRLKRHIRYLVIQKHSCKSATHKIDR